LPSLIWEQKEQILGLPGIMMVDGVFILFEIKVDDFMKASESRNTSVKVLSVIEVLPLYFLKSFGGVGIVWFV